MQGPPFVVSAGLLAVGGLASAKPEFCFVSAQEGFAHARDQVRQFLHGVFCLPDFGRLFRVLAFVHRKVAFVVERADNARDVHAAKRDAVLSVGHAGVSSALIAAVMRRLYAWSSR